MTNMTKKVLKGTRKIGISTWEPANLIVGLAACVDTQNRQCLASVEASCGENAKKNSMQAAQQGVCAHWSFHTH